MDVYGGSRRWAQVGIWYRRAGGCRGVTVAVDSYLVDCQEEKLRLGRGKVVRLRTDSAMRSLSEMDKT